MPTAAILPVKRFSQAKQRLQPALGAGSRTALAAAMFADVLSSNCDQHMVARIGGEEFVVLFEGLTPDVAGEILNDARSELGARTFRIRGTDIPLGRVTFSAGVAHCVDRDGEGPLKRADDLLYRAKNAGRNQVLVEAQ